MQHVFEFIVKKGEEVEPLLHTFYVSQSQRKAKVSKLIIRDIKKKHNIDIKDDVNLYIRKIR